MKNSDNSLENTHNPVENAPIGPPKAPLSPSSVDPSSSPTFTTKRPETPKNGPNPQLPSSKTSPKAKPFFLRPPILITLITLILAAIAIFLLVLLSKPQKSSPPPAPSAPPVANTPPPVYYDLGGEPSSDPEANQKPTFCVQVPNGLDGARPGVGLKQAKIVFEAIAEAGITRFAAIFQDPKDSVIGPIRSLRTYYLDWDVPFDCTIVHAGGSDEAIAEARNYCDLTESLTHMWRGTGRWSGQKFLGYYAPNNLFTSSHLLHDFNQQHGYHASAPKLLTRLKPDTPLPYSADPATQIHLTFGSSPAFNPSYTYHPETKTYLRSYADGTPHLSYTCPPELDRPAPATDCGEPSQIQPKVVIALKVQEWLDTDNYHHVIKTADTGEVYIFQQGTALKATWRKKDRQSQIEFLDDKNQPIPLTPGQIWLSALPPNGTVTYHY